MADPWTLTPRQLAVRRLLCRLTDHRFDFHPQAPPHCERCGSDEYCPARSTLGGWLERVRFTIKHRLLSIRRRFSTCRHCGGRFGRCAEDCPPF